ncbi:hypothetical protein DACRYDRAFT_108125 [Dacryopinax primogenitus]|uniref:Uncharacterized protein n=1 Tax=Dacryopinax primogenitus (strain DJM 731) TaxID=1858805 RepID=M5GC31_DACPD|nr:uncharacterized protein DACRYDRAFT_108125 [Dacryopinax primogenitus]EJU01588.1 hypothetical protein DACRYDRAFT_108125 [Dacryopinax primogenitus]
MARRTNKQASSQLTCNPPPQPKPRTFSSLQIPPLTPSRPHLAKPTGKMRFTWFDNPDLITDDLRLRRLYGCLPVRRYPVMVGTGVKSTGMAGCLYSL